MVQYTLQQRLGKAIGHADALRGLLLPECGPDPIPVHQIMQIVELLYQLLHAKDIAKCTSTDCGSCILDWVRRGWPTGQVGLEFASFTTWRNKLLTHKGCLLWGNRVVVPPLLCQKVLSALHEAHSGIVWVKALARSDVWWPGIDQEVDEWVLCCQCCQES